MVTKNYSKNSSRPSDFLTPQEMLTSHWSPLTKKGNRSPEHAEICISFFKFAIFEVEQHSVVEIANFLTRIHFPFFFFLITDAVMYRTQKLYFSGLCATRCGHGFKLLLVTC